MNLPDSMWNEKSLARLEKVVGLDVDVPTDNGIFIDSTVTDIYWYFMSNLKASSTSSVCPER
jgi:hypothetical protein